MIPFVRCSRAMFTCSRFAPNHWSLQEKTCPCIRVLRTHFECPSVLYPASFVLRGSNAAVDAICGDEDRTAAIGLDVRSQPAASRSSANHAVECDPHAPGGVGNSLGQWSRWHNRDPRKRAGRPLSGGRALQFGRACSPISRSHDGDWQHRVAHPAPAAWRCWLQFDTPHLE
jgi:hypothetical protein